MVISLVAKRYARALYLIVDSNIKKAKEILEEYKVVLGLFELEKSKTVLLNITIPSQVKRDLFAYACSELKNKEVLQGFFDVVLEAGRVDLVPQIYVSFEKIISDAEGTLVAEITSFESLSAEENQKIIVI